jgi:hypothetical protein
MDNGYKGPMLAPAANLGDSSGANGSSLEPHVGSPKLSTQNTALVPKGIRVYSEPSMSDHDPRTWTEFSLNDMFHCGRGHLNFYRQRTKENHKSLF